MLISGLCDYNDAYAYVVSKGRINVRATANTDMEQKDIAFGNNAPFRSSITKINITLIDNAEDLGIVMPMYNLLEYSQNYSMTSGILWNFYRDEMDDVDNNASDGKSLNNRKNRGMTCTNSTNRFRSRRKSTTTARSTTNTTFKHRSHCSTQIF